MNFSKSEFNTSWMTSFGDLLTLLFCFFVLIISNPENHIKKDNNNQPLNPKIYTQETLKHGTSVALSKRSNSLRSYRIKGINKFYLLSLRDIFKINTIRKIFQYELGNMAKGKDNNSPLLYSSVILESCYPKVSNGWFESTTNLLKMKRVLDSVHPNYIEIKLRSLGNDCTSLTNISNKRIEYLSEKVFKIGFVKNGI